MIIVAVLWLIASLGALAVVINPRLAVRVEQWGRR
jgi:hypothetical protein